MHLTSHLACSLSVLSACIYGLLNRLITFILFHLLSLNPAEDPGGAAREQPADRSPLKTSGASGAAANQRPAARKRSSQCLL